MKRPDILKDYEDLKFADMYIGDLEEYADLLEQIIQNQEEIIELWNMWFDKMEEKKSPRYVWCWTNEIEETVELIGKEPVRIETPCEFGLEWTKLYFEEE